jgi:hypothetical protein
MASGSKGQESLIDDQASHLEPFRGNNHTRSFHELVKNLNDYEERRIKWEKQRDESLGPILGQEWLTRCKLKEKSGQDISQRERDCLRLNRADEEWVGEARKVVSV